MTDTLLTSSILILLICVIRWLFKGRIRAKYQYTLWGLVALRLLFPFSIQPFLTLLDADVLWASPYSALSIAQEIKVQAIDGTNLQPLVENVTKGRVYIDPDTDSLLIKAASIDWELVILIVWATGTIFLCTMMLRNYVRFTKMLAAKRVPLKTGNDRVFQYPVYVVEGLKSPCLCLVGGQIGVYVTPEVAADPEKLLHVRVHEEMHARHNDLKYADLRTMLLCFYWVNPLVWLAAFLCKRDCELACDEAAVEYLGEKERFAYGRTLISLVAQKTGFTDMFDLATTMTGSGKSIRERVVMISKKKKHVVLATILVTVLAVGATAFTFAGRKEDAFLPEATNDKDFVILSEEEGNLLEKEEPDTEEDSVSDENAEEELAPAGLSTDMTLGADGPILDYASEDRVIFHGYFGLFVYDMKEQVIQRSLDLKTIGCDTNQEEYGCHVRVSLDGTQVILQPFDMEDSFVYHVDSGELAKLEPGPDRKHMKLYDGVKHLSADEMAEGNLAKTYGVTENGTNVYLTWDAYVIGDLRVRTDEGLHPYMFRPAKTPPFADISVNEDTLVPNSNYYLVYDGRTYSYDGVYAVYMDMQAYRKAGKGDRIKVELDEEALNGATIKNARVYDYWIDKEGVIKTWNRFNYLPLENVQIEENSVSFEMGMNMAQSLSSTYDPEGFYRGMAVECDLSDGNTAVYYFVLHTESHVVGQ